VKREAETLLSFVPGEIVTPRPISGQVLEGGPCLWVFWCDYLTLLHIYVNEQKCRPCVVVSLRCIEPTRTWCTPLSTPLSTPCFSGLGVTISPGSVRGPRTELWSDCVCACIEMRRGSMRRHSWPPIRLCCPALVDILSEAVKKTEALVYMACCGLMIIDIALIAHCTKTTKSRIFSGYIPDTAFSLVTHVPQQLNGYLLVIS
jgi:hypothetical protein